MAKSAVFIDLDRTLLVPRVGPGAQPGPGGGGGAARRAVPAGRQDPLRHQRPPRGEPRLHGPGPGGRAGGAGLEAGRGAGGRPSGCLRPQRAGGAVRPATPRRFPLRWAPARVVDHDAGRHDRPVCGGVRLRRLDRHDLRDEGRPLHGTTVRRVRLGDRQAARGAGVGGRARRRPGQLPRLQRQRLRRAAAVERGHAACRQPGPVAHRDRDGAALADRALGPPAGRPERRRPRAVSHAAAVRPPAVVPLCALRYRRGRTRPRARSGAAGGEPPQLLRCRRARSRGASDRPAGALPGQEGGVRRAGRRARSPAPSAESRSTGAAGAANPCGRPKPR